MPAFSAAKFDIGGIGRGFPFPNQSLTALEDGTLRPVVRDVLETITDYDGHVALGNIHLAQAESFAVSDAMEEMGLSIPNLVTHADFEFIGLTVEDQLAMADRGAIIEKYYLPVLHGDVALKDLASSIERIGPERCILSTDHGQAGNESPPAAYESFVDDLRASGLGERTIEAITAETPNRLLGADANE